MEPDHLKSWFAASQDAHDLLQDARGVVHFAEAECLDKQVGDTAAPEAPPQKPLVFAAATVVAGTEVPTQETDEERKDRGNGARGSPPTITIEAPAVLMNPGPGDTAKTDIAVQELPRPPEDSLAVDVNRMGTILMTPPPRSRAVVHETPFKVALPSACAEVAQRGPHTVVQSGPVVSVPVFPVTAPPSLETEKELATLLVGAGLTSGKDGKEVREGECVWGRPPQQRPSESESDRCQEGVRRPDTRLEADGVQVDPGPKTDSQDIARVPGSLPRPPERDMATLKAEALESLSLKLWGCALKDLPPEAWCAIVQLVNSEAFEEELAR